MVSLDYDDTIMAAAGHQAEEALEETIEKYKGNYIVAVEGNIPLGNDGTFCVPGGRFAPLCTQKMAAVPALAVSKIAGGKPKPEV